MDIRVGAVAPVAAPGDKTASPIANIEARVLFMRPPRSRNRGAPAGKVDQRRQDSPGQDPPDAKVLILMVPEGTRIPKDLDSQQYRVFLRFAKR